MATREVSASGLGKALSREGRNAFNAVRVGVVRAAHRGRAWLVNESDRKGITDTGQYKNAFQVIGGTGDVIAILENSHPMAGVIELGARPHGMSPEGRAAIAEWGMRKLGLSEEEADSMSWGVAKRIKEQGQRGRYVFRDAQEDLARMLREEVERAMRETSAKGEAGPTYGPRAPGKYGPTKPRTRYDHPKQKLVKYGPKYRPVRFGPIAPKRGGK